MMRVLALFCAAGIAWAGISPDEYRQRRAKLRSQLSGAIFVLAGASESENGNIQTGFGQEPNFLYLTGWREPGALLYLSENEEILFLPARSDVRERYTGRKLGPADADAAERTAFAKVMAESEFAAKVAAFKGRTQTITKGPGFARLQQLVGDREWIDSSRQVAALRMVKSPAELELLEASVANTVAAHKAAWKRMAAGIYEYQLSATIANSYFERGCERHAYPPIIASGPNSVVLHYMTNRRRMDSGEMVVMDAGSLCADYAADVTRTLPVSGHFTPRQREIYEIVLGAQQAAIAAAKPGVKLLGDKPDTLNSIAKAYVAKHGLEKYYLHSLGHHVGLEVHDLQDSDAELKPGMVVTIEPGIYIAEEGIGVRIEDMILITETGARVLSEALPRDIKAIEAALKGSARSSRRASTQGTP